MVQSLVETGNRMQNLPANRSAIQPRCRFHCMREYKFTASQIDAFMYIVYALCTDVRPNGMAQNCLHACALCMFLSVEKTTTVCSVAIAGFNRKQSEYCVFVFVHKNMFSLYVNSIWYMYAMYRYMQMHAYNYRNSNELKFSHAMEQRWIHVWHRLPQKPMLKSRWIISSP